MNNSTSVKFLFLLFVSAAIFILGNCSQEKKKEVTKNETTSSVHNAEFIGDESCISCHSDQHNEWLGSHHDWAMKEPDDSSVLGDFNNHKITLDGVQYSFERRKNLFTVSVTERNGNQKDYIIWKTFGFYPLQQYLVQTEEGKVQTLRVTWDSENNKWYHQYKDQKIAPNDWLHWTNGGQRWNTMCADCHSTDLRKNYDVEKDQFTTTYKTINVGCEACHGPGSKHISWTENPELDDNGIFRPVGQTEVLNLCGPCHSRRSKLTTDAMPWDDFHNHYLIQNLSPDFYELDGQIKEEDYVFGSFLSSKMYHEGVKCTDCHNPHSMKLKTEGNNLCLNCHDQSYNEEKHHKHQLNTESSQCINCHMTGKNFMGHDFRRDHSFRIPRPDQSVKFGTTNACNGCHENKSAKWAADKIIEWYGPKRQKHFSDFLTISADPVLSPSTQKELVDFVSDKNYPEIARSSVVENLKNKLSQEFYVQLIESIDQKDHLVLNSMLSYFVQESPEARVYIARQYLNHPRLVIRMNATKLLLDIPQEQLTPDESRMIKRNEQELLQNLNYNADFPVGRLQLGDYYGRKGNYSEAIKHYEMGIKMDSLMMPIYTNLATVYNLAGKNKEALSTLSEALEIENSNDRLHYLKGLLEVEMGNKDKAIIHLSRSISINRFLIKGYYNLAVIYYENQDIKKCKQVLKEGLHYNPNAIEIKEFLKMLDSN